MTFGRVADMLGRVRLYNLGFVVFTVGSALCGISQSATQLILFRLVQGSGAALISGRRFPWIVMRNWNLTSSPFHK